MQRHPGSMANRGRRIVAVDGAVHLGLYDSTWSPEGVPASDAEVEEIDRTLAACGLMDADRLARRQDYFEKNQRPMPDLPRTQAREPGLPAAPAREPPPAAHQLVVLGMHRSGTSVVSGVLERLGLFLGRPDQVLHSDDANPTGYWERLDVLNINQRLMGRRFSDAYQVGPLALGAFGGAREPDLSRAARAVVAELDAQGAWLMKDPRMCLTLPFWRPLLTAPACLIVTRHPLEIAQSLATRDRLPLPYGIALWERYCVEALRNSAGMPRIIVRYRDLMTRPAETVSRLHAELLRLGFPLPPEPAGAADGIIPSLHRHNASEQMAAGLLTPRQLSLQSALEDGSALTLGDDLEAVSLLAQEILARYPQPIDLVVVADG